jgi:hypothetical protein
MFALSDPVRVSSIIDLVETRFLTTTRASHPCDNGFTTLRLDHRFPPRSWPVGLQQVRFISTALIIAQRVVRSFVRSFVRSMGVGRPAFSTLMPENSGGHPLSSCKPQRNVL